MTKQQMKKWLEKQIKFNEEQAKRSEELDEKENQKAREHQKIRGVR